MFHLQYLSASKQTDLIEVEPEVVIVLHHGVEAENRGPGEEVVVVPEEVQRVHNVHVEEDGGGLQHQAVRVREVDGLDSEHLRLVEEQFAHAVELDLVLGLVDRSVLHVGLLV